MMITRRILLLACIIGQVVIMALSQEQRILIGEVIDKETKSPLPYCSIVNRGNGVGAISNAIGKFKVVVANELDTIRFSMVGFEPVNITASEFNKRKVIELSPSSIQLDEVLVRSLDFRKYIPKIYSKIAENFPMRYPTFDGVYRKQLLEDGAYVFLGECEVSCRNTKQYSNAIKVAIGQAYATINKAHKAKRVFLTLYSNMILYPYLYFITDNAKSDVEWRFVGSNKDEEQLAEVYVLGYRSLKEGRLAEEGTIQVSTRDDAILEVERHLYPSDNFIASLKDSQLLDNKMIVRYKYKKNKEGDYVLNYSRSEWSFRFAELNDEIHQYTLINDFFVTNYQSEKKGISTNASIDPFAVAKNIEIVDVSALKHLIPDYSIEGGS